MKTLFLAATFLLSSIITFGQSSSRTPEYNVPDEYQFILPEDYETYTPQIKDAIDWYLWRSMGFDIEKRQNAGLFFIKWLTGTPSLTVDVDTNIVNFIDKNPELLLPFMMGWTKYSIENNDSKDRIKGCSAGLETVVDYYKMNRGFLKKDENVEKYEKIAKKNKLKAYVKKNLPAQSK